LELKGSTLEASDCDVENNHSLGIYMYESNAVLSGVQVLETGPSPSSDVGYGVYVSTASTLEATDCVIRGNRTAGMFVHGSEASLDDVQILDTRRVYDTLAGLGLYVLDSSLTASGLLVEGNHSFGVLLEDASATLTGSQVIDTFPTASGDLGRGLTVVQSTLVANDCIVQGNTEAGVLVSTYSDATLDGLQISETRRGTTMVGSYGLATQDGAVVFASDLVVRDTDGPGLAANTRGFLSCTDCTVTDTAFAGASVQSGGELVLEDSLIEGTRPASGNGGGVGVFARDAGTGAWTSIPHTRRPHTNTDRSDYLRTRVGPPSLILRNNTIRDNEMGAVYIRGGGSYQLTGNDLSGGAGVEVDPGLWPHGDAVFVTDSGSQATTWDESSQTGLLIENNLLSDSLGAGLFLDQASATISGNTYQGNTVDLVRQSCSASVEPGGLAEESLSTTVLCPDYDYLTQDLELDHYMTESQVEF
jgi:hypothetical protein